MFCANGAIIAPTWTHSCQSSWRSQTARPLPLIPRTFGAVSSERVAHIACSRQRFAALRVRLKRESLAAGEESRGA